MVVCWTLHNLKILVRIQLVTAWPDCCIIIIIIIIIILLFRKISAWLGTSIMTDRETPLAEIVGQMSLSKNTDVSSIQRLHWWRPRIGSKPLYFLTTTSVQQFWLVEFPYRSYYYYYYYYYYYQYYIRIYFFIFNSWYPQHCHIKWRVDSGLATQCKDDSVTCMNAIHSLPIHLNYPYLPVTWRSSYRTLPANRYIHETLRQIELYLSLLDTVRHDLGEYVKMRAKTLVVRRFGGLRLSSSIIHSLTDEGSRRPPKRLTSVLWLAFARIPTRRVFLATQAFIVVNHDPSVRSSPRFYNNSDVSVTVQPPSSVNQSTC